MDCSKNHQLRTTLHDEFRPYYTHPNRSVAFMTSFCARNARESVQGKEAIIWVYLMYRKLCP
jgi:hypothetical protein